MTTIALFGATGTIGGEILKQALESGHSVQALVRDSTRIRALPGLTVIQGDATDIAVVSRTVVGADVVIDAIGPRANVPEAVDMQVATMTVILGAMRQRGAVRIIAVSGAAISLEGDETGFAHRIAGAIVRRLVRHVVEAKRGSSNSYAPATANGSPCGRRASFRDLVAAPCASIGTVPWE